MKLPKVKIIIEPVDQTNSRWEAALQGKVRSYPNVEIITLSSCEVLGRILSPPRLQILSAIPKLKPKSISGLAKAIKKDFKNVYSDVKFLVDHGFIDLRPVGAKKTLVPVAKFSEIELPLAA